MTTVLTFLYCFIGALWACYWLEELCHGIYLDARMWPYLWRMGGHIVLWPIMATWYLVGLAIWPDWSHFPTSSVPERAKLALVIFGWVGLWVLAILVRWLRTGAL